MAEKNNHFDADAAAKFRELLGHKKETEVRAINPNRKGPIKSEFVHSKKEFVSVCKKNNHEKNVYAGLNERRPGGTKQEDVISLNCILCDIDPIRKRTPQDDGISDEELAGGKTASTDEELAKAIAKGKEVEKHLKEFGIEVGGEVISGNGAQLLIPFSPAIEITDENRETVGNNLKEFGLSLGKKFNDEDTIIDPTVYELARISKVPGTLSIKGENLPHRPYRVAFWLGYYGSKKNDRLRERLLQETANKEEAKSSEPLVIPMPIAREIERLIKNGVLITNSKGKIEAGNRHYSYLSLFGVLSNQGYDRKQIASAIQYLNKTKVEHPKKFEDVAIEIEQIKYPVRSEVSEEKFAEEAEKLQKDLSELLKEEEKETSATAAAVHLSDTDDAAYSGKLVECPVDIAGLGSVYHIPNKFSVESEEKGKFVFTVEPNNPWLLKLAGGGEREIVFLCKELSFRFGSNGKDDKGEEKFFPAKVRAISSMIAVSEVILRPKFRELKVSENGDSIIDEQGKEYRSKLGYLIGKKEGSSTEHLIRGYVLTHPKNSKASLIINELMPLKESLDHFSLTKGRAEELKALFFCEPNEEAIKTKIASLCAELEKITHVYGREDGLTCDLLTFASPLEFKFEGEKVSGTLETAKVGDTTTGKTKGTIRLINFIGLGVVVNGECSGRTGITYSIDTKTAGQNILTWGVLPLNDRGLVVIDGANALDIEQYLSMREVRRSGIVSVDKVVKGKHPARVRKIFIANPEEEKSTIALANYTFPVASIRAFFAPPDIARTDLVSFYRKDDVSIDKISVKLEAHTCAFKGNDLRLLFSWAWSRKFGDVEFEDEAVNEICRSSQELYAKFGGLDEIPLITNDAKFKLAKIAAACAALVFSTDDKQEKVIVRKAHVEWSAGFIDRLYSADNCLLDSYAEVERAKAELSDEDYLFILKKFREMPDDANINEEIIDLFYKNSVIRRDELLSMTGTSSKSLERRISVLKEFSLIKSNPKGYKPTTKFIRFLKRLKKQKDSIKGTSDVEIEKEAKKEVGLGAY